MRSHRNSSLPWKAVLLGAILGYAIAILSTTGSTSTSITTTSSRILANDDALPILPHIGDGNAGIDAGFTDDEAGEEEGNHGKEKEKPSHHGEEEEEEEEGSDDITSVLDASITVIVLLLVVLTIFFEYLKETIEEKAERAMEPVIAGLFGELTVLGFLSTVTFCITKLGGFSKLGIALFGHEEEEELLEIFEQVHYMLFFIMVFFVVNVLVLMYGGKIMSQKWWIYNRACLDPNYMAQFHNVPNQTIQYPKYLFRALFPCRNSKNQMRSELLLFKGLRDEFLAERSLEPPFTPGGGQKVKEDFDFGSYLTVCQAHNLAHMVHLSYSTWIFLALVTVVFYGIGMAVHNAPETFAWIWACAGWLTFLLGTFFDFHMVQLLSNMVAPITSPATYNGEGTALLAATLPGWTQVDLDKYIQQGRSIWAKCFVKSSPNRQDSFYWFENKGPKVYQVLFQIQMVFTAAYVSLLCLTLLPFMCIHSDSSSFERWGYLIVALLPVFLLLSKYQVAAANLTMACSIGGHRRPGAIAQVQRDEKTKKVIMQLVVQSRLKQAAKGGFHLRHFPPQDSSKSEELVEEASLIFDRLDTSGDGQISAEEIGELFQKLGTLPTNETLHSIVTALDNDQNGSIDRREFLEFYKNFIVVDLDHHGIHELAEEMFSQLDSDGSGEISLSEFKDIIDGLDVGFTMDEIGALVNELDEQDDGTISEHEFVHLLLDKHRRLFEHVPLPDLE